MARIIVVGGYGTFGARIAERLARARDIEVLIAGRSAEKSEQAARVLHQRAGTPVGHCVLDAAAPATEQIRALRPAVVINASGPFQAQDYALPRACIAAGCHAIDLSDARPYVLGIDVLDAAARAAGVLVVSGASSVPGLSSAIVAELVPQLSEIESVDTAISPGNSFDPGVATTASVLDGVGRPIIMRLDSVQRTVHGWQGLARSTFPGLGPRWLGYVDVPDLELMIRQHPRLKIARFRAGTEVALFHFGIWGLSWLVRAGLVRRPERLAGPMLGIKRAFGFLGSDRGGMFVRVGGYDIAGQPLERIGSLVAGSGHGPYVPALASVILARKLARGEETRRGAMACFALVSLQEFMDEAADLDIKFQLN